MTTLRYRDSLREMLRERVLDAAQSITIENGWAAVTMSKVADLAGVSRQTLYNEFGTKAELAQELVARELLRFLEEVSRRLTAHEDIVAGIIDAAEGALTMAEDNPLLKAALDQAQNGTNDLLPLLTTQSQGLIDTAVMTVTLVIESHYSDVGLTPPQLKTAADAIVRIVLSHIMRPSGTPRDTAEGLGWIASLVLVPRA